MSVRHPVQVTVTPPDNAVAPESVLAPTIVCAPSETAPLVTVVPAKGGLTFDIKLNQLKNYEVVKIW